jgi:tape measure domain-containing protein
MYIAAGASASQAEWLTKRTGDIVAGVGGGAPEIERAALAFGKILAGGRITGQEGRELKDLGIHYEKVLQQIMGAKNPEELAKPEKQGKITADIIMEMVKRMTDSGGIFQDGMLHFAETFTGLMTSISDMWHRFQADFGDIINQFGGLIAKVIIANDGWRKISTWMDGIKGMSENVVPA